MGEETFSVAEAAAVAGVSCQAVHVWIARGRLPAVRGAGGVRIDPVDLARVLAVRRAAATAGVHGETVRRWVGADRGEGAAALAAVEALRRRLGPDAATLTAIATEMGITYETAYRRMRRLEAAGLVRRRRRIPAGRGRPPDVFDPARAG